MASERRRFLRFKAQRPTYAALGQNFDKVGKVKDISLGGFAFEYISEQDSMEEMTQVDLILLDENLHVSKVPCTVVYECELKRHETLLQLGRPLVTRQCGVKFGNLEEDQRTQLDKLIARQTLELLP